MLCCRPPPSSPFPAATDLLPIPVILPFLEFHINEAIQCGTFWVYQEHVAFLFLSGVVSQSATLGEVGPSTWLNQVQTQSRRKGSPRARPRAGTTSLPLSLQAWTTGRCWSRWSAATGCPVPRTAPSLCTSSWSIAGKRTPKSGPRSNICRASWKTTSRRQSPSISLAKTCET